LPLKNKQLIEERLDIVQYFIENADFYNLIVEQTKQIGDIERLISKVSIGKITPRELIQLKRALYAIETIKNICKETNNIAFQKIAEQLNPCLLVRDRIEKEINPDAPVLLNKGNVILSGISPELDEIREIAYSGKDFLLGIQQRESEKTGITSLKIAYNNIFGYYIEVTNTHKDKVPSEWHRKQTLTNCERYITDELKVYEEKILGAEENILTLEAKIYNELIIALIDYIQPIQLNASLIARLDCLLSFAANAKKNNYSRPEINESLVLDIINGRHPVIEQQLPLGEPYIGNDIYLDTEKQQIAIITGPNMSGKSALLRQTALIVLMAQMGSFVSAQQANIGLVDKIFTRVGASDNITSGESTFMVEMNETASILNNISERSLILLDEIGRGTSTYDGISIAWSIAEYIHEHIQCKAKTLFATHYHELNDMAAAMPRIKNFNVSIKEIGNKVLFLRKLVPGGSEHSFGIHVARMAGMPTEVVKRAEEILAQLEQSHNNSNLTDKTKEIAKKTSKENNLQLSFIQLDDPLLEQIKQDLLKIDINTLTPNEALMKLNEIKQILKKNK